MAVLKSEHFLLNLAEVKKVKYTYLNKCKVHVHKLHVLLEYTPYPLVHRGWNVKNVNTTFYKTRAT